MIDALPKFRTYDAAWNRTGYADRPQYSGQAAHIEDYPAKCHCGAAMKGCGKGWWIAFRGHTAPAWAADRRDYIAWCANGHEMTKAPV